MIPSAPLPPSVPPTLNWIRQRRRRRRTDRRRRRRGRIVTCVGRRHRHRHRRPNHARRPDRYRSHPDRPYRTGPPLPCRQFPSRPIQLPLCPRYHLPSNHPSFRRRLRRHPIPRCRPGLSFRRWHRLPFGPPAPPPPPPPQDEVPAVTPGVFHIAGTCRVTIC